MMQAPARLRRRRLARAAHAADQHPRQPRAARGLARARGDDDDDAAAIGSALRSSKRMSRLVSDLLLLARADAGRTAPGATATSPSSPPPRSRRCARSPATASSCSRPSGRLQVTGNPDELHRLVLNLLDNAVRHTPEGTTVGSARRDGPEAVVEVADDGPGLPEGLETQVFERFVRGAGPADRASRRRHRPRPGDRARRRHVARRRGRGRRLGRRRRPFIVRIPLAED